MYSCMEKWPSAYWFRKAASKILWFFCLHGLCSPLPSDLEKAIATPSSSLAGRIPRMEEPGRLQSIESLSVGHDWAFSLSLFTFMHWRRKWQPTPVFLPGEFQGQGSLVDCCLWGRTELDTTSNLAAAAAAAFRLRMKRRVKKGMEETDLFSSLT